MPRGRSTQTRKSPRALRPAGFRRPAGGTPLTARAGAILSTSAPSRATINIDSLPRAWRAHLDEFNIVIGDAADEVLARFTGTPYLHIGSSGRVSFPSLCALAEYCCQTAAEEFDEDEWQRLRAKDSGALRTIRILSRVRGLLRAEGEGPFDVKALESASRVMLGSPSDQLTPFEDFVGEHTCVLGERLGYPILELHGDGVVSVASRETGHQVVELSASEYRHLRAYVAAIEGGPASRLTIRAANPNRWKVMERMWPETAWS